MKTIHCALMRLLLIACTLLCYSLSISANEITESKIINEPQIDIKVSGVVTDDLGSPLIGVSVVQKGTTIGTMTDRDGRYSLSVPSGVILEYTYVGFIIQAVKADREIINIVLLEKQLLLDEVVVVGYGVQHKKDITGSVAVVNTKDLLASSGSSATQQLQGKAAGVYIGQSGSPGSPAMVRIRGINTVNDNGPLYVIDGVSTRNQDLSSLNPNDIESMQVLKDASSAAIYGSQAANGVILITTKKGLAPGATQPTISYDGYMGVQMTTKKYDLLGSMDRINLEWDAKKGNYALLGINKHPSHVQFGTGPRPTIPNLLTQAGAQGRQDIDPSDYSYPKKTYAPFSNTNWWDEIDRTAMMQNHQVSVNGGSDKGKYSMSLNYYDQDGTQKNTNFKRYQIRVNTSFDLRKWLRVGENMTYGYIKDIGLAAGGSESNAYSWVYRASPYVPVRDIMGNYAGSKFAGTGNFRNPVAINDRNKDNSWIKNRVFGNIWAEVDLYKGLMFRTSYGLDYNHNHSYRMEKKEGEFSEDQGRNNLQERSGYNYRTVWTNTMTYNITIKEVHKLNVLLGTEYIKDNIGRDFMGRRYGYAFEDDPSTWVLDLGGIKDQVLESNYKKEFALFGVFGRVDYAYNDKYLFTGIIRRDGSSRFDRKERYGTFPSVSVGWRISSEDFMSSTRTWLDDMKFRFGYGETGNSDISRADNAFYTYKTDSRFTNYDYTGGNTLSEPGFKLGAYGNKKTKWETTSAYNVGLDATFLNGKFGLGAEWYYKKTKDMLVQAPYSALAGDAGRPYINIGDMKNVGFDLNLYYKDSKGDWAWDFGLNIAHYKNEVLKLSDQDDYSMWGNGTRLSSPVSRTTKGHAVSEFYGYKIDGFYETPEEVIALNPLGTTITTIEEAKKYVGKFKFKNVDDSDDRITANDRTFIGSPHPDVVLGLNTTVRWRDWDLTTFWYSTIGNELFNNTKYFTDFWTFDGNKSSRLRDKSWTPGANNKNAKLPILDYADDMGKYPSSYYVEKASFLRLKNLVVGYSIPKSLISKVGISNLRIYAQAENLFTITSYKGLDPEFTNADVGAGNGSDLSRGIDMGGWPTTRKFLFGVNLTF